MKPLTTPGANEPLGYSTSPSAQHELEILRERDVARLTGLSRWTRRRLEERGNFPQRVVLVEGGREVGWLAHEVRDWIASRAAARS